ncbi:MAG: FAD binding domain-containing protein [Clostridia bacterium]|nr:FAD binding domain-containing protein [Clostridia bacterium]
MKYATAFSAKEALEHLINAEGNGIVIAGGTDVMVDYKDKRINPEVLVDVTKCEDMQGIAIEGDKIVIGASTTLTEIARSPIINKYYPSLAKGAGTVGSLQIRNSGTLTGNVVSAQPAGDAAMAVAPLDPIFTVLSAEGTREMTMAEMYKGFGKSHIDHSKEIVTKITLPIPAENEKASFIRLELRKSLSLPMLNCAAFLRLEEGKVACVRITMAPVGVGPVRAAAAEEYLMGKELTDEVMAEAGKLALENANPRSNPLRGSREYRLDTLPVLVRRALEECKAQMN